VVDGVTLITYVGELETLLVACSDKRALNDKLPLLLPLNDARCVDSNDSVDTGEPLVPIVPLTEGLGVTVLYKVIVGPTVPVPPADKVFEALKLPELDTDALELTEIDGDILEEADDTYDLELEPDPLELIELQRVKV
jgi:hypothetical protein